MGAILHFGTDGWRARVDGDFTEENVARVAEAAARVWSRRAAGAIVYVGFDTRPDSERFARLAAGVLAGCGLVAKVSDRFIPTPALSWSVARDPRACGGLMVTGSHSPNDYLGVKLRVADGGIGTSDFYDEIEDEIDPDATAARGPIAQTDLVTPYLEHLQELVDTAAIASAGLSVVYDPLYGSARGYLPAVLGELGVRVREIHGEPDGEMDDLHPEPIEPWVDDCEQEVLACGAGAGLVNDGDADRVGAVDERGRFVRQHRIFALIVEHLVRDHGLGGRVVVSQSTSLVTRRLVKDLGLKFTVKPIGFKHIYEEMLKGDVLIGGESTGGFGIPRHMPERDGVLMNLLLCELMAQSGKTLGQLVDELEERYGTTCFGRRDLRLESELIEMLRTMLPGLNPGEVAGEAPVAVSHMDGLRFEFADESWLLLRPSGTEPLVRVYAEAATIERRDELIEAGCGLARGDFS